MSAKSSKEEIPQSPMKTDRTYWNIALAEASRDGNVKKVQECIQHGADVNGTNVTRPLWEAVTRQHVNVVSYLLSQGANTDLVETPNQEIRTLLQNALHANVSQLLSIVNYLPEDIRNGCISSMYVAVAAYLADKSPAHFKKVAERAPDFEKILVIESGSISKYKDLVSQPSVSMRTAWQQFCDLTEDQIQLKTEVASLIAEEFKKNVGMLNTEFLFENPKGLKSLWKLIRTTGIRFHQEIPFDDFQILSEIGRGSFGVVFKARKKSSGMIVALKKTNLLAPGNPAGDFKIELAIMSLLQHENLLPLLYAGREESGDREHDWQFAVMPLMEYSLESYIRKRKKPIDLPTFCKICYQTAKGLAFLHAHHLIHRDIKPANLLMDKYNNVKIADYGLVRLDVLEEGEKSVLGTFQYFAPELLNRSPYDCEIDIYAFGLCLYQMATFKHPFESNGDWIDKMASLKQPEINVPLDISQIPDPEYCRLITSCAHKDPKMRIAAAALCKDEFILKHIDNG